MADTNSDPRPPVVVSYNITWPGVGGGEEDTFEIPRDEWDAMTPAERVTRCDETVKARFVDLCGYGWHIYDQADFAATEEK